MWRFLFGKPGGDPLSWHLFKGSGEALGLPDSEDGLVVGILFAKEYSSAFGAIARARELTRNVAWIDSTDAHWVFDFDGLPSGIADRLGALGGKLQWLAGRVQGKPEYVKGRQLGLEGWGGSFNAGVCFYFTPRMVERHPEALRATGLSCDERWSILGKLGEGGQGCVYLVRDKTKVGFTKQFETEQACLVRALRRITQGIAFDKREAIEDLIRTIGNLSGSENLVNLAALKVLHGEEGRHFKGQEDRIKREIEGMRKFSHPNLATVLDSNADEKWFVSHYYPHRNLEEHRRSFAGNVPASLQVIRSLASGVAELHRAGIVHRDIKPENVFVTTDDQFVLGDFGLVYFTDSSRTRLSGTLENVGSWDWAPEWAKGRRIEGIEPTFDVFSLGKVLWWLVSGEPVEALRLWYFAEPEYQEMNVEEIHSKSPFIRLVNPLLAKCVVEKESDCLQDAGVLLDEIDRCLAIISNNADPIGEEVPRTCKVCGLGRYQLATDNEIDNSFRRPAGRRKLKMFTCNHCGNCQFFLIPEDTVLPAWRDSS